MAEHGGDIYAYQEVLDFSVNVNPLGMPEEVKQAAKDAVELCAQYPDVEYRKLRRALARREKVPVDHLICANGAAELVYRLVRAMKPKKALLPTPTFSEYERALQSVGCETKHHLLREEENFAVTERILEDLTSDVDVLFLCVPNNPTGQVISRSLLFRIFNHCKEKEIFLVVDECFLEFLPNPDKHTLKLETQECGQLFLLRAFTKSYAMAGLRLGYGICADTVLLAKMEANDQPWALSIPAQEAGLAAIRRCDDYLKEAKKLIEKERDYLTQKLGKYGFKVFESRTNFLLFFSEDTELDQKLLDTGILIRSCANFNGLDEHYFRIAVKTHKENKQLIQAIKAIKK